MRRKKWSEEEEQTLISKYGEMSMDGTLLKLKTREKKFEPIALHVNAMHHARDSVAYPWDWSWRDLSVKIQNMRHQYLGVKQKIRRPCFSKDQTQHDEYDWDEGIIHWPNFLRYKAVFGDLELESNELGTGIRGAGSGGQHTKSSDGKDAHGRGAGSPMSLKLRQAFICNSRLPGEGGGSTVGNLERDDPNAGVGDAGGSGLVLECCDEDDDVREGGDESGPRKKKLKRYRDPMEAMFDGDGMGQLTEMKILEFLSTYISEQRERDIQREVREREKERKMEERDLLREAAEREREQCRMERERLREDQERRREREREEREWERDVVNRDRWEEEKQRERSWEERREKEKQEWRERMTALQLGHQASIAQMQAQMIQSQQNFVSLLLNIFLHGSPVEETPGQRSTLALQILHNLQQQHIGDGAFHPGERKDGIDDGTAHYVMD